jgi:hypothetical protein
MEKLIEHTYGTHIYMKMRLDNGRIEEIDVFITNDGGMIFRTSADNGAELDKTEERKQERENLRQQIIKAFCELY